MFLAIAAPWHILAALRNPAQGHVRGFLWFYFVNEHFLRFLNKRVPRDYDTVPLLLVLGAAGLVADSVDRVSSAVVAGSAAAMAGVSLGADDAAATRVSAVFSVERGDCRASSASRPGRSITRSRRFRAWRCWSEDGWRGSGNRRRRAGNGARDGFRRPSCWSWAWRSRRLDSRSALFLEDASAGHRSFGPAQKESAGLCALVWTLSRSDAAGDGSVSIAAGSFFGRISVGYAGELDVCAARAVRRRGMARWR